MKILLLANKSPWPAKDGGSAATAAMISGLTTAGAALTVVAFNTIKHFTDINLIPEDFKNKSNLRLVTLDTQINPVKLIRNLILSDKPLTLERFESEEFKKVLSEVLRNKFDIVQVEGLSLTCYISYLRQSTSSKIVFRPHNIESKIWDQLIMEERNILKKLYWHILAGRTKKFEKNIMNDFDAVIPISPVDRDWFISSGLKKPCRVIPPGLTEVNKINPNPCPQTVCFI